jgi:hypothetical protein
VALLEIRVLSDATRYGTGWYGTAVCYTVRYRLVRYGGVLEMLVITVMFGWTTASGVTYSQKCNFSLTN